MEMLEPRERQAQRDAWDLRESEEQLENVELMAAMETQEPQE